LIIIYSNEQGDKNMVGTKSKSGGKREGAGHPTLIEQFENVTAPMMDKKYGDNFHVDVTSEQEDEALALYKKIVARKEKIEKELAQLERFMKTSNSGSAIRRMIESRRRWFGG
jgi:hypothetical protein